MPGLRARRPPSLRPRDVRWHARLCLDARTLEPATAQAAFVVAAALPGPHGRDAAVLLAGIGAAHDLADVAEVLDEWRARPDPVSPPNS